MGIYDRDYYQPDYEEQANQPQLQFRLPQLTPVVKWLLILNVGIFLLCVIVKPVSMVVYEWFSVDSTSFARFPEIWRLISYQFLHDPSTIWHLALNMMGLYFLGPVLERFWHSKKFLIFYLACGATGGVFYLLLTAMGITSPGILIGASGAILGMLAACAILFPQFVVFLFVFPVPIRVAAVVLIFIYVISIFMGAANSGGDAAHLAGMAVGAGYVYLWPRWKNRHKIVSNTEDWEKKFKAYSELQKEVDRILEKVNREGISSLTKKEKKILAEATKLEQMKSRL